MQAKKRLLMRINEQLGRNKFLAETLERDEAEGLKRLTAWIDTTQLEYTYLEVEEIVKQRYCEWKLERLLDAG